MNERIRLLAEQAQKVAYYADGGYTPIMTLDQEKFAQLIVAECANIVANRKDQAIDNGLNVDEAMSLAEMDLLEHFGVAESQSQFDQAAAEFIAAEDKKVASRYGYFPKLHPSEWKD
jgi:hypothetical protein